MKNTRIFSLLKYFSLAISLLCLVVLGVIFIFISPDDVSPVLLLVIFVLQYGLVFGVINGFFIFFEKIRRVIFANLPLRNDFSPSKRVQLVTFLSLIPIVILATQSIKPLGFYELFLILIIAIFGMVFICKK